MSAPVGGQDREVARGVRSLQEPEERGWTGERLVIITNQKRDLLQRLSRQRVDTYATRSALKAWKSMRGLEERGALPGRGTGSLFLLSFWVLSLIWGPKVPPGQIAGVLGTPAGLVGSRECPQPVGLRCRGGYSRLGGWEAGRRRGEALSTRSL